MIKGLKRILKVYKFAQVLCFVQANKNIACTEYAILNIAILLQKNHYFFLRGGGGGPLPKMLC